MSDIDRVIHQLSDDIVGRLWAGCVDQYEADFLKRILVRAKVIWLCQAQDPDLPDYKCGHLNNEHDILCRQCGTHRALQADAGTNPGDPDE